MRFEIEVNTIPHGSTGKVNPIFHWDGGRNGPPYEQNFCLYGFFSPDPTPFPGTGELCSNHFYQNNTFVTIKFFSFFVDLFHVSDSISHQLKIE